MYIHRYVYRHICIYTDIHICSESNIYEITMILEIPNKIELDTLVFPLHDIIFGANYERFKMSKCVWHIRGHFFYEEVKPLNINYIFLAFQEERINLETPRNKRKINIDIFLIHPGLVLSFKFSFLATQFKPIVKYVLQLA